MRYNLKKLNQSGAAAMLSVVIFSIIITIVVTAYLRNSLASQSQSLNYDYNNRAYFAAEVGIQDALRSLGSMMADKDDCNTHLPASSDGRIASNLSYTCQLVDISPKTVEFDVGQDKNAMVRILPKSIISGNYKLVVRWSIQKDNDLVGRLDSNWFPGQADWRSSGNKLYHPALRLSLIDLPVNGDLDTSNLHQNVLFLNPISGALGQYTVNYPGSVSDQDRVQSSRCYNSTDTNSFNGYSCQQVLSLNSFNFSSSALYVRSHSLYGSTGIQLALQDSAGNEVELAGSTFQVDVTGRAGSAFKRIKQTFKINNGVMIDNLPDAAVVGGDGICKYYEITDQAAGFKDLGNCL
jgi:hypothetical protein